MNNLKKIIETSSAPLRVIGGHHSLGALLGQEAGFDAIWFSGFEFSAVNLVPDANILSMSDIVHAISSITKNISIPLIADCDTGFGDIANVIYMTKEYEKAGVAAVCIEDKIFPKSNSFYSQQKQKLIGIEDFIGKVIAIKNTRRSSDLQIIARIESFIAGAGLNDALERAEAYEAAGADMLLIHSKAKTHSEILDFCDNFKSDIPLVIVPTTYNNLSIEQITKLLPKIKIVIYANHGLRNYINTTKRLYKKILVDGSTFNIEDEISSLEEVFKYHNVENYTNAEKQCSEEATNILRALHIKLLK